jgi:hypothetical protein
MVQWQDEAGDWRGVGPRTRETKAVVPALLFGKRTNMLVRVLASSGVATAVVELELKLQKRRTQRLRIVSVGSSPAGLGRLLRTVVVENDFRTAPGSDVRWYDDARREIGRGRTLPLEGLRHASTHVRAVVHDRGSGDGKEEWIITRGEDGTSTAKGTPPKGK